MKSASVSAGKSLRAISTLEFSTKAATGAKSPNRVVERSLVEELAEGVGAAVAVEEDAAVGRRLGHAVGAGHAAGAGHVLDDHRLSQQFREPRRHDARRGVDWAAGGKRNQIGRASCRERGEVEGG